MASFNNNNYTSDCGSIDFKPWNVLKQDFGQCFFHIGIELPIYGLFAISSAYYTGKREITYSVPFTWNTLQSFIIYLRAIFVSFLVLSPIIQLMIIFGIFHDANINIVEICIVSLKSFAWILHLIYTLRLKRGLSYNTRGPKPIIFIWSLTAIVSVLSFRTQYFNFKHLHPPSSRSQDQLSSTSTSFLPEEDDDERHLILHAWISGLELLIQGLYFLTIIPSSIHLEQRHYRSIFEGTNAHESHSILNHESNSFVGFQEEDEDPMSLGIAKEDKSFLSKLTISWVNPLMMKGCCGYLRYPDDLFDLPPSLSTANVAAKFQDINFATQHLSSLAGSTPGGKYSLVKSLHKNFGLEFYAIGILKFVSDACGFCGPVLLNLLVSHIEGSNYDVQYEWEGYIYVVGLFFATLIGALSNTHFNFFMMEITTKMRAALMTYVYKKTLLLRRSTIEKFNTGEIINYMSTDTSRITNFCPSFHAVWSLPIQIVVSLYLLYMQIGLAFLAGLIFAILLIPINKWIANKIGNLSTKMMHYKDLRTKLMSEILYGIRVLRFHSWESFFSQRITKIREKELSSLRGRKYLDALCVYFWATTPVLVSLLSFGTYVLLGNDLTAAKVFTSLALFNMLITPLNALPWVINGLVESWVSVKRINKLLEAEETDPRSIYIPVPPELRLSHDIIAQNASFDWGNENNPDGFIIKDLNIEIKKGQFIGVTGDVGSAKTSLLLSLLGELTKTNGNIRFTDKNNGFGIVLQDSWIQRGTIRRNILFGKQFNLNKYSDVIINCCLEDDLNSFDHGDDTIVGENGVTLSGGQKQRVNLARAIYQDKTVYLLDDIFSAVDQNVGRFLYKNCIMGLLKAKTRILCTHQPRFLRDADVVLIMDKGRIINSGPPSQILPIFFDEDFNDDSTSLPIRSLIGLKREPSISSAATVSLDRRSSPHARFSSSTEFINKPDGYATLIDENEEKQEEGTINVSVYKFYMNAVGKSLCFMILMSLLGMQATKNISDLWLSHWVSNSNSTTNSSIRIYSNLNASEKANERSSEQIGEENWILRLEDSILPNSGGLSDSVKYYFAVFIMIGVLNSIVTFARAFLFAYGGIKGGKKTHVLLLRRILRAKLLFFDTTPIGRIINRFASDVFGVDDSLPFILNILLAQFVGLLGTLVVTCYALPWILVLVLPLVLVVHNIMQYYRHTARQLRRLSNISLSPVFAHFSETLKGLVTIRGMRASKRFENENENYVEANQKCQYSTQAVSQWLGFRLQIVGLIVITGTGLIGALQHRFNIADPGLIGLALSYALTLTGSLNGFVTFFTETEKEMVSVERSHEYITQIEEESRAETKANLPYGWPSQGVICFKNVYMKYRNNLPYALRNVSFETRSCEKIGIVGRTGSGKSSLFQVLFRMVDDFVGNVIIDTVDTKQINLKVLRSHMWIIPQDPLLFSGTLRENLDPKGIFSDENLENAIRKCQLTDVVQHIGGIDGNVGESGNFLSAGQKQLVCLGRALLVNPKILCIDEATASCDLETDKVIQSTIRSSFRHTTILTVAHRVNTILHSDRVIVMDDGQIVEIDAPEKLILDKSSYFYRLAQGNS